MKSNLENANRMFSALERLFNELRDDGRLDTAKQVGKCITLLDMVSASRLYDIIKESE